MWKIKFIPKINNGLIPVCFGLPVFHADRVKSNDQIPFGANKEKLYLFYWIMPSFIARFTFYSP